MQQITLNLLLPNANIIYHTDQFGDMKSVNLSVQKCVPTRTIKLFSVKFYQTIFFLHKI